jgi:hypothetical protein
MSTSAQQQANMNLPPPPSQPPPSSLSSVPLPPPIPSPPQDEDDDDESKIDEDQVFPFPPESEYFHRPSTINELASSSFSYQRPTNENISIFGMDYIYDLKDSFTLSNYDHSANQKHHDQESLHESLSQQQHSSKDYCDGNYDHPTPSSSGQSLHQKIHKEMKKLYHIINEFLSTEISYVHDIHLLSSMLHDCYYCTIPSVKLFVDSKSFGGFYVSCDNIVQINTQFLQELKQITHPLYTINDITDPSQYLNTLLSLVDLLTTLFSQYFQLFSQYKHFITFHRPLSLLFSSYYANDLDFHQYIDTQQQQSGSDSFLSLSIKPVQRLPRYILLCKEMHNTLHKILQCFHPNTSAASPSDGVGAGKGLGEVAGGGGEYEQIYRARQSIYSIHAMISNCTLLCNNTMKDYDDLQQLHSLHNRLYGPHSSYGNQRKRLLAASAMPIVVKGRIYVLEGELYRQHRRGGNKLYLVFLFNDIMIFCSPSGSGGGGLRLELTIPLYKNSNTLCLPLPSPVLVPPANATPTSGLSLPFLR